MIKSIVFALTMFALLKISGVYPDMEFFNYAIGMGIGGVLLVLLKDSKKGGRDDK